MIHAIIAYPIEDQEGKKKKPPRAIEVNTALNPSNPISVIHIVECENTAMAVATAEPKNPSNATIGDPIKSPPVMMILGVRDGAKKT